MRIINPATASILMTDCHIFADPVAVVAADCVSFHWSHTPFGRRVSVEGTVVEDPAAVAVGYDAGWEAVHLDEIGGIGKSEEGWVAVAHG